MNGKMSKKLKYGGASVAITAIVIAGAVLLNFVAGILTDRFSLKLDLTPERLYDLSDQTRSMIADLEVPVSIHVLMEEADFSASTYLSDVNEIMQRYASLSNGNITLDYTDIYKNPSFVNKYTSGGQTQIDTGSVIVESAHRFRIIPIEEMFELSNGYSSQTTIKGINAEEKLTSAISYVADPTLPTAVIITGHNESVSEGFISLLTTQNYQLSEVNLSTGDLPEDTSLVIISGPQADYSADELKKLDSYLRRCGDMVVFFGIETPELPELELLFSELGVEFEDSMVFDPDRSATSNPLQIYPLLSDNEMNKALSDNVSLSVMTPAARSIVLSGTQKGNIETSVVLETSSSAYTKAYSEGTHITTYDAEEGDKRGVFNVAVLSELFQYQDNVATYGRVLFVGSDYATADTLLSTPNLLNSSFFMNAMNYLTEQADQTTIFSKDYYSEQLIIMGAAERVVFWLLIVVIPLVILGLGVWQWRKRRNM